MEINASREGLIPLILTYNSPLIFTLYYINKWIIPISV
ncbi:hypothetical protein MmTuc01_2481 [Methanosarcina mazei Tuc01]|uniref:Uncharacterized protein n=1 Tax=Methanosarcina mazei Tuc01 TaxID=1236903 RepID=M1PZL3_METMZ|nr:hypothetical protein MmTuc01_2481 [Methanosarcina mazei Tuc01]